ncbi:MAG TPA: YdcF family protein, partial [Vicinamibacterales bacterium]|nr:YdcF family protein [Vicinamibacterales bacterium]
MARLLRAVGALVILLALGGLAFLPFAGSYLVESDPLTHADALYVLGGTRAERMLEAYDLYKAGDAPFILLSPDRREYAETVLTSRGIRFPTDPQLARDALEQMGVPPSAIVVPDESMDNTAQEAVLLRDVAVRHHWTRVIIVTSAYHSRRTAFAFHRALAGTGIETLVHPSRYDEADPAHWWRHRYDARFVLSELGK